MPPLLIVKLGDYTPVLANREGDFESWISSGLGDVPVRVVDPRKGEALPAAGEVAAAVLTGSPSMVTDREAWSEATARWLAGRVAEGLPVLGICYGHQLLAHALGGEADWHPQGMEIGTVCVRTTRCSPICPTPFPPMWCIARRPAACRRGPSAWRRAISSPITPSVLARRRGACSSTRSSTRWR